MFALFHKYLHIFFCYKKITCNLEAGNDIQESHDGFVANGIDPQFRVKVNGDKLTSGWYILKYHAISSIADSIFVPKIYDIKTALYELSYTCLPRIKSTSKRMNRAPSGQKQYDVMPKPDPAGINLRSHQGGDITHIYYYHLSASGFRFDPFDMAYPRTLSPSKGWFNIKNVEIIQLGIVPLTIFCATNLLFKSTDSVKAKVKHIKIFMLLFLKRGIKRSIRWQAHQTYKKIQPVPSLASWLNFFSTNGCSFGQVRSLRDNITTPFFTLLLFVDNIHELHLTKCLNSIIKQTYSDWQVLALCDTGEKNKSIESCLRNSNDSRIKIIDRFNFDILKSIDNTYLGVINETILLEAHALERHAYAIAKHQPDIVYGDEAVFNINSQTISRLNLRPAFNYDQFLASAFTGLLSVMRASILTNVPHIDEQRNADTMNEYLMLCALEKSKNVLHIPDILVVRIDFDSHKNKQRLGCHFLKEHLNRIGFKYANVSNSDNLSINKINFHNPQTNKTAIIIPTKNQGEILKLTLKSIEKTVPDEAYDLFIVDHESDEKETISFLNSLKVQGKANILKHFGPFNFSKINNDAVKSLNEEYEDILFLNNDIEATHAGWLESMKDKIHRQDVGIVGSILLYPNEQNYSDYGVREKDLATSEHRIQHAGVILGIGIAEHYMKDEIYRNPYLKHQHTNHHLPELVTREFSAVTAACMMIKTKLFKSINGFDENLHVGFGDVDLCLRVKKEGYKILCDGESILIHHESASRDRGESKDPHPLDTTKFRSRYQSLLNLGGDPFYHPLLTKKTWRFRVRRNAVRSTQLDMRIVDNPINISSL